MSPASGRLAMLGFRPGPGGIGRVMCDLIDGLAVRGIGIDLLLPRGDYPELARLAHAAPQRFDVDHNDGARAARQLTDYLGARGPAAILSNKDKASALLARVRRESGTPRTVLRIGSDVREKTLRQRFWRRRSYKRGRHAVYAAADAIIGNSQGVVESLRWLLGDDAPPLHRIPNPMDLERIKRLAANTDVHPWCLDREVPLVISVGRLVAVKDFDMLIRAFARVLRLRPARLLILGEGRQRCRLERLIKRLDLADTVALPGFAANPFAHVARADMLVLSSRYEGSPNALIEALACGTPCVATDCRSGPREVLEDGRLGPLVPVGNVAAMADAMARTLAAPPDSAMLVQAARRFDRDDNAALYARVLGLMPGDAPQRPAADRR